ncbi:MAG: response regulator [Chitinophagaceae bacterium]|nr:MAG: response regulator [Chitinophagaceae bacterium]
MPETHPVAATLIYIRNRLQNCGQIILYSVGKRLPFMPRLPFILAALLLCTTLHAQVDKYSFSRIDISNGLSHNQVNSILRDETGFIWFATMSGLNRYDSYGFKVFRHNPADSNSINDNYVSGICQLPGNDLWVNTRSGGTIYKSRTEKFDHNMPAYQRQHGLPVGTLRSVIRDRDNNFWFAYDSLGIARYEPASHKVTIYNSTSPGRTSLSSNLVSGIRADGSGAIWIIHRNGIVEKLDPKSGTIVIKNTFLRQLYPAGFNYDLFVDRDSQVWIWTLNEAHGVFLLDPATNTIKSFNESSPAYLLNNNLVTGVIQDGRGKIWIGTDHGGINLVDKTKNYAVSFLVSDPKNPRSLAQNSVYSLYKDETGIIWVGTFKQGINYLDENIVKFAHYRHSDTDPFSLPYEDINAFAEDKAGNLWIGTNGGGVIYFDRQANRFRQYTHNASDPGSLSNNVIVTLYIDNAGTLWIGTYLGGLNSFDGKKFTRYHHSESDTGSLADDRVWKIFEDSKSNLWVGTLSGGLDLLDRNSKRFTHHQYVQGRTSPIQSNYISAIMEDRDQNLWVGTAYGIDMRESKSGKWIHYGSQPGSNSLSNNNVISMFESRNGMIWIATREGLNLFDPASKKFRSFDRRDGLPDNTILTNTQDNQGNLWITTPNGLCKLVLHDGGSFEKLKFSVVSYDVINNLQGREFNENAACRTRAGEVFVGGPSGFNMIDPSMNGPNTPNPTIVFTSLQILNREVTAGQELHGRVILEQSAPVTNAIRLRYSENIFSVEFAALDFSHGSNIRYAYKLEGFNKDWVYANGDERRIVYTNLDPGTYLLKVKAFDSSKAWSEEKTMEIRIDPPFWKSPLAFFLYVLVIIAALYIARRVTLDRARMRFEVVQQRKEAERVQALDQMKTKFFTNVSHEFRTPLSLILSPLDRIIRNTHDADNKQQLHLVHRNAKRLLNLVNQLLDFRKLETEQFRFYPVAGDIVHFINEICFSFSDIAEKKNISFDFHSSIDSLVIHFDSDKIEKIMFNLLSNAYKYTHDSGVVWVHLNYTEGEENFISIEVGDTGIGIPADKHDRVFERFFQHEMPDSVVNQGSGIGLAITSEFVKLHKGTIRVTSEPGKGSVFTVQLPVTEFPGLPLDIPETDILMGPQEMSKGKKTILLVEDNEDFRFYLKDNLKHRYHVTEAVNGKDAWEKIRIAQPDLIVSDIVMPLMSGTQLAQKVKADGGTAHIPIILLTAMGTEEMQLEGYRTGANDYIRKPFTFEILESRIRNLLTQQNLLERKFNKKVEMNPSLLTVTPVEEQFLKQAVVLIEQNISNPAFSVEDLSRQMFMSRVALYKKVVSLTGKGPLEFIRGIRLKRAAQLLGQSGMTIAEVAYEVGFNNPKTFSKYFREEFHMLPSQYQDQKPGQK